MSDFALVRDDLQNMNRKNDKAILFDFDGTLVDTADAICHSFRQVLISHGLVPMDNQEIRMLIGRPLRDMFRLATGWDASHRIEQLASDYRRIAKQIDGEYIRLFPGVEPFLARLPREVQRAIVTSRSHAGTRSILRTFDLEVHFQTIVGIDDVVRPKPDPEPVFQALDQLGAAPENAVVVGDTISDMMAGINAGTRTVGITSGAYTREELVDAGAEMVVAGFSELAALLVDYSSGVSVAR